MAVELVQFGRTLFATRGSRRRPMQQLVDGRDLLLNHAAQPRRDNP